MDRAVIIQPLKTFDVPGAAEIIVRNPLWQRYGLTFDSVQQVLLEGLKRSNGIYSARIEARLVGLIWFDVTGTFYHSGYIRWVAVHPDFQNRGLGKILLKFAEEKILSVGPNVFLLVSHFNRSAQRFYERLDYRKVGELPDFYKAGITEWIYRKTVGPIVS